MTQFQSDPSELANSLKTRVPTRGVQPPQISPDVPSGGGIDLDEIYNRAFAFATGGSPAQPSQEPASQEVTLAENLMAPITEPLDTWGTAAGVIFRSTIPKVIGALQDTAATLATDAMVSGMKKGAKLGSLLGLPIGTTGYKTFDELIEAERRPEETDAMFLSRWMIEQGVEMEKQGESFAGWLAHAQGVALQTGVQAQADAKDNRDSFIGWSNEDGRWFTMSVEEYAAHNLRGEASTDPGIQTGMFVGNAVSSAVPSALAIINPAWGKAVFGSFFAQGFSQGAQKYDEYKLERGERPDDTSRILHGTASGAVELIFEMLGVRMSKKFLNARQAGKEAAIKASEDLGTAIVTGRGIRGAMGRFADSHKFTPVMTKIAATNAAEEVAVTLSNNVREVVTYDDDWTARSLAPRIFEGTASAAAGGAIGGAAISGPGAVATSMQSPADIAAREQAARLRMAMPADPKPVPSEGFAEGEVSLEEDPDIGEEIAALQPAFDQNATAAERKKEQEKAKTEGRIPEMGDLPTTAEAFVSEEHAEDVANIAPALALVLLDKARKNKGSLPRSLMNLVYAGRKGESADSLSTEQRKEFIKNLEKAVDKKRRSVPLKNRSDRSLAWSQQSLKRKRKRTEEDNKELEKTRNEIDRRSRAAQKEQEAVAKDEAERGSVAEEIESEVAEEYGIEDETGEFEEVPQAATEEAVEETAEEAAEEAVVSEEEVEADEANIQKIEARINTAESDLENDSLNEKQKKQTERRLANLLKKFDKAVDSYNSKYAEYGYAWETRAESAERESEEAEQAEMDAATAEAEEMASESDALAGRSSESQATMAAATEAEDADTAARAKEELEETGDEATGAVVERLNKAGKAASAAATVKPDPAVPDKPSPEQADPEAPLGVSGILKKFGTRLGILAEGESGKPLSEMSDTELIAEAKKTPGLLQPKYATRGGKLKESRASTVDMIIEARMAAVGLSIETLESAGVSGREAGDKVLQYALAPRRKGDGKGFVKTVISKRLSKAGLGDTMDAAVEEGFGRATKMESSKESKKPTKKDKSEFETVKARREAQAAARRKRIEAANETLNPDSIGVVGDPVELPADETAKTRAKRIKAGVIKAEQRKPVEKMSKAELLDEIVDDYESVDESGPATNPQKRKSLKTRVIGLLRDEGVLWTRAEGKGQMVEIVNRIRRGESAFDGNQLATPESEMTPGQIEAKKARRLEEGEVSARQKAEGKRSAEARRKAGKEYREALERQRAKEEGRGTGKRTLLEDVMDRVAVMVGAKGAVARKRVDDFIDRFERGDIVGRPSTGKKNRKDGVKRYWARAFRLSHIAQGPDAIVNDRMSLEDFAPRLWARIKNNLESVTIDNEAYSTDAALPEDMSLADIDAMLGTDFTSMLKIPDGPEADAVAYDIIKMVNMSAEAGQIASEGKTLLQKISNGLIPVSLNPVTGKITIGEETKRPGKPGMQETEEGERQRDDSWDIPEDPTVTFVADPNQEAEGSETDPATLDAILDEEAEDGDSPLEMWSRDEGAVTTTVVHPDDVEAIVEEVGLWQDVRAIWRNITGKFVGPGGTFSDFLDSRISAAEMNRQGTQVTQEEANTEIEGAIKSSEGKKVGLKKGDLVAVPDSEANKVELDIVKRWRAKGRRVILMRANTARGHQINGFVSKDSNTIYVRVSSLGPNMFSNIKDRSARSAIEKEYGRIMLQIVRHENFHLIERDPDQQAYVLLVDNYLNRSTDAGFADAFESEEAAFAYATETLGMSEGTAREAAQTKGGRAKIVSELRAEAASEIDALRRSGGESLLINRGLIDQTMDRVRRVFARAGFRGTQAKNALQMIEFDLKLDVAQSTIRARQAAEAGGKKIGKLSPVRFSADLDIDGQPVFHNAESDQVLFSMAWAAEQKDVLQQRQKWQDRNIRLRKVVDGIETDIGARIPDNINPAQLLDITPGLLARQSEGFMAGKFRPLLRRMAAVGVSPSEMGRYLHAKHAEEANKYLAENKSKGSTAEVTSGMTNDQAEAIIKEFEEDHGSQLDAVKEIAEEFQDITRETLEIQRKAGLITQKDYDRIKEKYKNYVPLVDLTRSDERFVDSPEFSQIGNAMLHRQGREDNVLEMNDKEQAKFFGGILASIAAQRGRVMRNTLRNNTLIRLMRLAEAYPELGFEVIEGKRNKDGSLKREALKGTPVAVVRLDKDTVLFGKPFRKGEEVVVKITDPEIAKMLNTRALRLEDISEASGFRLIVAAATKFTSAKRALATRFSVNFILPNPVRDMLGANASMAAIGLETSIPQLVKGAIVSFPTILANTVGARFGRLDTSDPQYQEYIDSGARQSSYRIQSPEDMYRLIGRDVKAASRKTKGGRIASVAGAPIAPVKLVGAVLSDLTNTLDDMVRFSAWKMARAQGMTTQQATAFSRDATVDFSRHGDLGAAFNQVFAFSNVGTQAGEKLYRMSRSGKMRKVAAPFIKMGLLQSLLCALCFDDEEYENIREDIKRGNLVLPIPGMKNEDGSQYYFTMPLTYGLNSIHNATRLIGDSIMRPAMGSSGPGFARIVSEMASSISQISPVHSGDILAPKSKVPKANVLVGLPGDMAVQSSNFWMTLAPDILDPLVEAATGFDWTGRPIWQRSFDDSTPDARGKLKRSTSPIYGDVARLIGDATGGNEAGTIAGKVDLAPETYQFLMARTLFGPAQTLNRVSSQIYKVITGEQETAFGIEDPNRIPVLRRFVGKTDSRSMNTTRFYEFFNELKLAKKNDKIYGEEREAGNLSTTEEIFEFFGGKDVIKRNQKILELSKDKTVAAILTNIPKLSKLETEARRDGDWEKLRAIEAERQKEFAYIRKVYSPE